ncbi:DUF4286 family protein [Acidianus manzaensis]|uniref:Uncharacterized protein n=1 Tax=Acidianus manzaensis TaxID=282676 RepID=A0A1W6JYN3_9CREN|nr:DUF4286 family protein [Acidianus manzaensis]ARM75379.1 hypothetical protein B6F84_04615 [Acidianus manzaensis]
MKGIYVVRVDVLDNNIENNFNKWYSYVHLPDLMKIKYLETSRRFFSTTSIPKYLSLYEFPDKEKLIEGKNSEEMKYVRSDTIKRWNGKLSKGERYYTTVEEIITGDDKISDSNKIFVSYEDNKILKSILNIILSNSEKLERCIKLNVFDKEPEDLPKYILLCDTKDKNENKILEMLKNIDGIKGLGFYEPIISYYKITYNDTLY